MIMEEQRTLLLHGGGTGEGEGEREGEGGGSFYLYLLKGTFPLLL